MTVLEAHPCTK